MFRSIAVLFLCFTSIATMGTGLDVSAQAMPTPEIILGGVDQRTDAIFKAEAGKPLKRAKKQPPLSKGRGPYVRAYTFSIMAYAARCLYLNEQLGQANAALAENAQYYLDNPLSIVDRDSFHWHADVVMRLLEHYGSNGSVDPGRITPRTEALLLEPIWIYVSKCSWAKSYEYKQSKTWNLHSSENHHAMHFTVCWHFSKIAKDLPRYKDRTYVHGGTPADHYRGWSEYFVEYCKERARRGFGVEMMSAGYNATMMKAIYNLYDFGEPDVKAAAGLLLDLYFAYWAQEQIDGVQGGGKSRIYFGKGLAGNKGGAASLTWLYFGIGEQPTLNGHDLNPYLSSYRPPAVVVDIARDVQGRGRYEVWQRAQGLGKQGHTFPLMDDYAKDHNQLATDGGGILRYSYCDPSFIMGTPMVQARPLSDWVAISSQNRWQGVIFAGDNDARIVPVVRPKDNWRAKNAQWSVQSKGTLITQKLKGHRGAGPMVAWLSKEGISKPIEEDGVVFVVAERAYAAIRVAHGGYDWHDGPFIAKAVTGNRSTRDGRAMIPKQPFAPLIVEVMAKKDIDSFMAFRNKVKACKLEMKGPVLHYTGIYGDTLTLDTSFQKTQTINGRPVDYTPPHVYKSPFMNADYEDGVVTITKDKRKTVLDFNQLKRN